MTIYERQDLPQEEQPLESTPQSRLGVASFIIGLVSILGMLGTILMMFSSSIPALPADGSIPDFTQENAAEYLPLVIAGLLILLVLIISVVGFVLGIIGLAVKHRRKTFGIIGVVLNGLLLVSCLLLFLSSQVLLG